MILEIENLSKSFYREYIEYNGDEAVETNRILSNINLKLPERKISALIGGNGSGKTTLFNLISGFLQPDVGKIYFGKYAISTMKPHKRCLLGIGRVFQDNHIFENLTVLENMLIADNNFFGENPLEALFSRKKIKGYEAKRIEKTKNIFSKLFGAENTFWKLRYEKAGNLSYGQQRLLGLARIFMNDYSLILLDEPTAGVNEKIIVDMIRIIKELVQRNSCTVFLIEHNMDVVKEISDYCFFLENQTIVLEGNTSWLFRQKEFIESYLM